MANTPPSRRTPPALPEFQQGWGLPASVGVPCSQAALPDGRWAQIAGDFQRYAPDFQAYGGSPHELQPLASLVLCVQHLHAFGQAVSVAALMRHAISHGLGSVTDDLRLVNGVTLEGLTRLLAEFGLPAHLERGYSLEDLAHTVETGAAVLIAVNASTLWSVSSAGEHRDANHVIRVTAVARDVATGEVLGFLVDDVLTHECGRFVAAATMEHAWTLVGGWQVVTVLLYPSEQ